MELLIALLSFFSVAFSSGDKSLNVNWSSTEFKSVVNSEEYQKYLNNGGISLGDVDDMPPANVKVNE